MFCTESFVSGHFASFKFMLSLQAASLRELPCPIHSADIPHKWLLVLCPHCRGTETPCLFLGQPSPPGRNNSSSNQAAASALSAARRRNSPFCNPMRSHCGGASHLRNVPGINHSPTQPQHPMSTGTVPISLGPRVRVGYMAVSSFLGAWEGRVAGVLASLLVSPQHSAEVSNPLLIGGDCFQHGVSQEWVYQTVNCADCKSL